MGLGRVAQHQVAIFLIRVGFLRVGLDDDEPGENGLRGVEQGVFIEQVRGGVRRRVGLQRALVELARAVGHGEGEHLGVGAGPEQARVRLVAGLAAAKVEIEREHTGVAFGGDAVDLEGEGLAAPVLGADVGQLRALGGVEIVHAGHELALGGGAAGDEELHQGGLGPRAEHHEGVREGGDVLPGERVLDHEGEGDLDVRRDVEEGAGGGEGGVERDELLGAEVGRVFQEIGPHEVAVIAQGLVKRGENHAAGGELGRDGAARHDLAVGEHDLGGLRKSDVVRDAQSGFFGKAEAVEVEALQVGEAPGLVGAGRKGQGGEPVPGGLLGLQPPGGQVGALGQVLGEAGGGEALGGRGGGGQGGSGHGGRFVEGRNV